MLMFSEEGHIYKSIVPDNIKWTSVTSLLSKFKQPFNNQVADKNVKDPKSKWYGMQPDEVRSIWKKEADRSTTLGSWFHKKMEDQEYEKGAIQCCRMSNKGDWKIAGDQELKIGNVYPEFLTYNKDYKICGQADRIEVTIDNHICISDYKTNKVMTTTGFNGKKLLNPVSHLDDCHINIYALQLSFYMWMLLQHNPTLYPGSLTLYHVKFKTDGIDEYGYPISSKNEKGEYIPESISPINVPYLESEIVAILNTLS